MKITIQNLKNRKKQLVTLACKIVHARDKGCRFCGRTTGRMVVHHVCRRGGFFQKTDTSTMVKLCTDCDNNVHRSMGPLWEDRQLARNCPEVMLAAERHRNIIIAPGTEPVQEIADRLEGEAQRYDV